MAAVCVGAGLISRRGFQIEDWDFYLFQLVIIGVPFGVLAVARTRDWLAWLLAVILTAAVWGYYLYDLSRHEGVNFLLGPIMVLLAPITISGFSLVTAGMRRMIPDWGVDEEAREAPGSET